MIVVRLLIVTQLIRVVDSDHHTDSQKEPHLNPFKLEISNLSDTPLTGEGTPLTWQSLQSHFPNEQPKSSLKIFQWRRFSINFRILESYKFLKVSKGFKFTELDTSPGLTRAYHIEKHLKLEKSFQLCSFSSAQSYRVFNLNRIFIFIFKRI